MTVFSVWSAAVYCVTAGLVVGTVIKLMTCCAHHYNDAQRIGLGMMAGGMTMVIGSRLMPLISVQLRNDLSPFNVWPGIVSTIGILIFLISDAKDRTLRERFADLSPFSGYPR